MPAYQITVRQKSSLSGHVYVFIVNLTDSEGDVSIVTGSTKRALECVYLTYNSEFGDTSGELQNFEFSPKCAENTDMKSGLNGTVLMMLASLRFIYEMYPKIKCIEFNDKSTFPGEISVSTIEYYFLKTGESWYQRIFGAELVLPSERQIVKTCRTKLASIVDISAEDFIKKTQMIKPVRQPAEMAIFNKIYIAHLNNRSWMALFGILAKHSMTKQEFVLAVPKIRLMLDMPTLAGTYWRIKKSRITKMIDDMIQSIEIKPTDKQLGQAQMRGGSRIRSSGMIHMHPGWSLGNGI